MPNARPLYQRVSTRPLYQRVSTRPLYQRPAMLALVFFGGAAGTFCRWLTAHVLGDPTHFPHGTLAVNLAGALLLGLLLGFLEARGPETPRRRDIRLLCGTGFMGGFTTYSAFAVQQVQVLWVVQAPILASSSAFAETHLLPVIVYAGVSLVGGLVAALAGMAAGAALGAARGRRESVRVAPWGEQDRDGQSPGCHHLGGQLAEEPTPESPRVHGSSGKGPRDE